jgi:hypothetical protein
MVSAACGVSTSFRFGQSAKGYLLLGNGVLKTQPTSANDNESDFFPVGYLTINITRLRSRKVFVHAAGISDRGSSWRQSNVLREKKTVLDLSEQAWGENRVFFYNENARLIALPASWTDFVSPDPFVVLAAGRSLFRAEDLFELVEQIRSFDEKDGRHV